MELLCNCSHGSEIATYLDTVGFHKTILKSASTPAGLDNLLKELAGWDFYQKIRHPGRTSPLCWIDLQKDWYLRIRIEYILGHKGNYREGLEKNARLVDLAVSHYCEIWPYGASDQSFLHGDLSIDNIIQSSDGIYFIDWEHFTAAGPPWGFDAVYLIFETLWFGMRGRALPGSGEIEIVSRNLRKLKATGRLAPEISAAPLRFLQHTILAHLPWWGDQLRQFPNKLPVLRFSDSQVAAIEGLISKNMEIAA